MSRYVHDAEHPARRNKNGRPEPTRQPRYANRLYCLVWADHDLFKLGLGSGGRSARSASARKSIARYFGSEAFTPGTLVEWRAELPFLEGQPWGDCQRLEMVFATALKRRLEASVADAVGLEWLTRGGLENVAWKAELTLAAEAAMVFTGLDASVQWDEYRTRQHAPRGSPNARIQGASQLDSHRTMRNRSGQCAMRGCGAPLPELPAVRGRFLYCSEAHAERQ